MLGINLQHKQYKLFENGNNTLVGIIKRYKNVYGRVRN